MRRSFGAVPGVSDEMLLCAAVLAGRSELRDDSLVSEGLRRGPLPVGRDEVVCGLLDRCCDNECVRKSNWAVCCSEPRRGRRDLDVEPDDRDGEAVDEIPDGVNCGLATASGANQAFGESRCCKGEAVTIAQGAGERYSGVVVMCVAGVEEPNDDPGVEVDQSHSCLNSSSSLAV